MNVKDTCCFECKHEVNQGECLKGHGGCVRSDSRGCRGDKNAKKCKGFDKKQEVKP